MDSANPELSKCLNSTMHFRGPTNYRKTPQDTHKTPKDAHKTPTRHRKGPQERSMQGYYRYSEGMVVVVVVVVVGVVEVEDVTKIFWTFFQSFVFSQFVQKLCNPREEDPRYDQV